MKTEVNQPQLLTPPTTWKEKLKHTGPGLVVSGDRENDPGRLALPRFLGNWLFRRLLHHLGGCLRCCRHLHIGDGDACHVSGHAVVGVGHAIGGFLLIWSGRYLLFERVMTVLIGNMFLTIIGTATLFLPSFGQFASGFIPVCRKVPLC